MLLGYGELEKEIVINPEVSVNINENDNISFYYFGKPYVKANSKIRVGLLISTHDEKKMMQKSNYFFLFIGYKKHFTFISSEHFFVQKNLENKKKNKNKNFPSRCRCGTLVWHSVPKFLRCSCVASAICLLQSLRRVLRATRSL